jgi:uncharacterized DUF497 family protein
MLSFEWDSTKAKKNIKIYGISFDEASSAFKDTLSLTIYDPLHSEDEERQILIGNSHQNRLLVIVHTERGSKIRIQAQEKRRSRKGANMKKMRKDPDMLEEYDFSKGIRGKYAKRYAEGTNVIVIEPDIAKYFPDHDSVNQALRSLSEIIKKQKKFA